MKTILLPSPLKAFLFALIILAVSSTRQQVYGQVTVLASVPTAEKEKPAVAKSAIGFQSAAFPIGNAGKVQVIFEDPTGKGASIVVRDTDRTIFYRKDHFKKGTHMINLDLSPLPDGSYTVEVIALTKAGFNKEKYSYNFRIQSSIQRSITPWNKELEKSLFTPRPYQVSR